MAYKGSKHADVSGNVTWYGETTEDMPDVNLCSIGDVFICKASIGILTYMLLPKGNTKEWWKVG